MEVWELASLPRMIQPKLLPGLLIQNWTSLTSPALLHEYSAPAEVIVVLALGWLTKSPPAVVHGSFEKN